MFACCCQRVIVPSSELHISDNSSVVVYRRPQAGPGGSVGLTSRCLAPLTTGNTVGSCTRRVGEPQVPGGSDVRSSRMFLPSSDMLPTAVKTLRDRCLLLEHEERHIIKSVYPSKH